MTAAVGLGVFSACGGDDSSDTSVQREADAVAEFTEALAEDGPDLFVSPRAAVAYAQLVCFDAREDWPTDERGDAVTPFCSDSWLLTAPLGEVPDEWP